MSSGVAATRPIRFSPSQLQSWAPDSGLHRGDPAHAGVRGDPAQDDAVGPGRVGGQLRGEPDQYRLLVFGNESRGAQARSEVSRLVVRAGLPFAFSQRPAQVEHLLAQGADLVVERGGSWSR